MNFIQRITGLLTSPDKAQEDVAKEPRIEEAVVVVAIYAVLYAIFTYVQTTKMHYVFTDPGAPDTSGIMTIFSVIFALIMPFIAWVIVSALLYLFSMVFGGEGKFTHVLTAIGYSTLPKLFAVIIGFLLLTQATPVNLEISTSNPLSSVSAAADFSKQWPVMAANLVMLVGVIWSSLIGMFGIKHTEKLSFNQAAIVVGIPLAIYLIMQLAPFVLG